MSYTCIDELPSEVRKSYDEADQNLWMDAYNRACDAGIEPKESRVCAWSECKSNESSRYVCANVSTEVVDKEGDLADVKAYVEAGQKFAEDGGVLMKLHSNKVTGTVWKIEEGIDESTNLPCVVAHMNFYRGSPLYDQTWEEFKKGRQEFSIASLTKKPERECSLKGCFYRLIPEQWYELSNVDMGINPITYPVEVNDAIRGENEGPSIKEEVTQGCPFKDKYLRFKDKMGKYGHQTHYGDYDEKFLLIHGPMGEEEIAYLYEEYPDVREFEFQLGNDDGSKMDYTMVLPKPTKGDKFIREMGILIGDEREAITGYNVALNVLRDYEILSEEEDNAISKLFEEIIEDETRHIGNLMEVIRIMDPLFYSLLLEGMEEAHEIIEGQDETKGVCPAGQHEHSGVWGCHDILRRHQVNNKTLPTDKLDLTDENIDVPKIQGTSTEKLREIVTRVAKILSKFDDEAVQEFLSSPPGKEFVLAFLELKKRTGKEKEMIDESTKGMGPDIQSSIANIATTLASITAIIDQMNIRMMKLEENREMGAGAQGNISDAILAEAQGGPMGAVQDETQGVQGGANEAGESKNEVPQQLKEAEEEDVVVEDGIEEGAEKVEDVKPGEGESEKPDDAEGGADESEDEGDKPEDEGGEGEPEKKEEGEPEKKEEDAEDKEDDGKEKKDLKKGEGTIEDGGAGSGDVKEDVAEEIKGGDGGAGGEGAPKGDGAGEPKGVSPQVAPEGGATAGNGAKGDFEYPIPSGGQVIDFRAMLLQRQAELKEKGVEMYVAEDGAQNSLANTPTEYLKGSNVALVHPSKGVSAFDMGKGIGSAPTADAWKLMGRVDSQTFLKKIVGE